MATKKSQLNSNEIAKLEERIKELELQNEELQETAGPRLNRPKRHFWRSFGAVFFVTLSIVSFMLFNIASWTKNTLLDTETFVTTMQPLISQPDIQSTIQQEVTTALFTNIDVEAELQNALPENVAFIAGPLAAQVEGFVSNKVGEVLASPQAYEIWGTSLTTVHSTLVGYIQDDTKDGVLSVNDLYTYASQQLGADSNLSFLLNKQLPESIGTITITEISWLPQAREYVSVLESLPIVLLMTSFVSLGLAILLALNKRRVILWAVILSFVMMGATLLALEIGAWAVGEEVQPIYANAAQAAYSTITQPLADRTIGYGALMGAIAIIIAITSNNNSLIKGRKFFNDRLTSLANKLIPRTKLPSWMYLLPQNRIAVMWTSFLIVFIGFGLRIPPVGEQIINAFIGASILVFVLHIISLSITATTAPKKK